MITQLVVSVLSLLVPAAVQVSEEPAGKAAGGTRSAVAALANVKQTEVASRGAATPKTVMDRVSQLANHMDRSACAEPSGALADRVDRSNARRHVAGYRVPYS